jgi:alpha-N-acetylglucosamine transferase
MVIAMKESGRVICIMGKVNKLIKMVQAIKDTGLMMRKKDREYLQTHWVLKLNKFGQRELKYLKNNYDNEKVIFIDNLTIILSNNIHFF